MTWITYPRIQIRTIIDPIRKIWQEWICDSALETYLDPVGSEIFGRIRKISFRIRAALDPKWMTSWFHNLSTKCTIEKKLFKKTYPKKLAAVKNIVYKHAPSTVFRIRIRHFRLNIEQDPDPIRTESGSNPRSSRGVPRGGRHRVSGRLEYISFVCILQKLIYPVVIELMCGLPDSGSGTGGVDL